ncbi:hypothetical protein ACT188_004363 [Escherichia coli]|uniref:hypothetical protein n=1 Tax=Escherichia coli TaxID=562 RepID=UPI00145F26BE|nr:hypothetical protein [Escherichia coli]EEZ5826574.1 hypothetical protein [Escherichia coli]EEZ7074488.1 hypothetical protein [Escherichia coli]EFG1850205.1 hypothetical protein [Escherichia coli]EFG3567055.1 hypothetical protein [Escherichia coli]EFJ9397958.1 hypothetical protein [Escherichia coli]
MTVARRGIPSARVCGNNQNDAHRVFTALMIRGFVPHARQSCARVEETGHVFRSVRPWSHDAGLSDIEFIANKPERLRVLSGDPAGYGAATSRVFAIYENFPV